MTKIDPTGPVPPYKQIAAIIRARIASGEYPPGTRIPTESEMVESYGIRSRGFSVRLARRLVCTS